MQTPLSIIFARKIIIRIRENLEGKITKYMDKWERKVWLLTEKGLEAVMEL